MKICLVIPPACGYEHYARFPSLGVLYIASVLEKAGHEVIYRDCLLGGMGYAEFYRFISEIRPDIVGISVFTESRFSAFECARIVKKVSRNIRVVCGGPHATTVGYEVLESVPEIDAVIRGEGEYAFREFLERGPADTKGITYRENDSIISNADHEAVMNLDDLPRPAWHLANMDLYFKEYIKSHAPYVGIPLAGIITGRGCSRRCVFCAAPKLAPRIRRHSPQYICDLVKFLIKEYNIRDIYFLDDTFTDDEKWILLLKEEFEKNDIRLPFQCQGISIMSNKTIDALKDMGCYYIYIGAESGSPKVLRAMNKAIRTEDYERSVRYAAKKGIMVHTHWLVGIPEEDNNDLKLTLSKIIRLPHHHYSVATLILFPGTKLSERFVEKDFWKKRENEISQTMPILPNHDHAEVSGNFILLNASLFCFSRALKYIIVLLHENVIKAIFSYIKQILGCVFNIKYLPFRANLVSDFIGVLAVGINRLFLIPYRLLKNYKKKTRVAPERSNKV